MKTLNNNVMTDFSEFARQSMQWCMTESERETSTIFETIRIITTDIERRSKMSQRAATAMEKVKQTLSSIAVAKPGETMSSLLATLKQLSDSNEDVQRLVNPIVEALQFQDRFRQNLENISKFIDLWHKAPENQSLHELGVESLKCMTGEQERDVIRAAIPGLPEQAKAEDNVMLF